MFKTLEWIAGDGDSGYLRLLDQTRLPNEIVYSDCRSVADLYAAILELKVRGAPAIGASAAYGLLLSEHWKNDGLPLTDGDRWALTEDLRYLRSSRPTAVNLGWALDRVERVITDCDSWSTLRKAALREAELIRTEDMEMCDAIGRHGAPLLEKCDGVLTHCNTGRLATAGVGTALAVIAAAAGKNNLLRVYADETRPLLQGARLTMWELEQLNISATLICDSMAAQVMRERRVQAVVVGADRIASNGDVANKIGTYAVAIAAKYHGIPFYVAAPSSTFDLTLEHGDAIPIEQRQSDEIRKISSVLLAPAGCDVYNPAFDVTPAELVSAIITERGVIHSPTRDQIAEILHGGLARISPD